MSAPPQQVAENEIAFFFQTNEPIPASTLLNFLCEVDRIARTKRHLGPDAIVEILEVRTGTKLVKLSVEAKIGLAALAIAILGLGNDLSSRLQSGGGRFAESVAQMCIDNGVVECVITTSEAQVRISRDQMPAVKQVKQRRSEKLTGYGNRYGLDYGASQGAEPALDGPDKNQRPLIRGIEEALPGGASSKSRAMDIAGRFIKIAGQNAVVFETGENVFEVSLTSAGFRELPLDEDVIARCTFDWADASTVFVHSWTLVKPR